MNKGEIKSITGKTLDVYNLDIDIDDMAWSLSRLCRWNGHCNSWFSVAEHCVRVSRLTNDPLAGLLHDASEYVLGDVPGPIKKLLPDYQFLERIVQEQIKRYFCTIFCDDDVKEADGKVLQWEYRKYVIGKKKGWSMEKARRRFLKVLCANSLIVFQKQHGLR
jgi:hypothetical protein